jgi:hypothetical protein
MSIDFLQEIVFIVPFAVSFLLYISTVSPSIAGGDSGELVAEGCKLGTPHPPGYPLYTFIVYVVVQLGKRIRSEWAPAYWVNLTSCIFGSLTSAFLSLSTYRLLSQNAIVEIENRPVTRSWSRSKEKRSESRHESEALHAITSIAAGLLNTVSPLAWTYHVTAEVFALNNLFVALIIYASIQLSAMQDESSLFFGAFLCGFSLTNQHTSILLSIPMILWALFSVRRSLKMVLLAGVYFFSGIVVLYGMLILFAFLFPHPGSWGDLTSLSGLVHHMRRKDYGTFKLYSGNDNEAEGMVTRCIYWAKDFVFDQSQPIVGFFLMVGCFVVCIKGGWERIRSRKTKSLKKTSDIALSFGVEQALLCSLIFYLIVFHSLSNLPLNNPLYFGIHQRFWMHPNILAFIIYGIGMNFLLQGGLRKYPKMYHFFLVFPLILPMQVFQKSYSTTSQVENVYFSNYAKSILNSLPEESLLIINYDQQWTSIRYLQECENLRPDVTSINLSMMSYPWWITKRDLYPHLTFPGTHYSNSLGFSFKDFVDNNYNNLRGNIFIGGDLTNPEPSYSRDYTEIPHGIVRKIDRLRSNEAPSADQYRDASLMIWNSVSDEFSVGLPNPAKYGVDTWESTIVIEFYRHLISRSVHLLDLATRTFDDSCPIILRSLVEAIAWMEIGRIQSTDIPSSATLKNLGLGYMYMVRSKVREFPSDIAIPFISIVDDGILVRFHKIWYDTSVEADWKTWASLHWKYYWGSFLNHTDSKSDPSYNQVKSIYEAVLNTSGGKSR